jgi:hypothetical protein
MVRAARQDWTGGWPASDAGPRASLDADHLASLLALSTAFAAHLFGAQDVPPGRFPLPRAPARAALAPRTGWAEGIDVERLSTEGTRALTRGAEGQFHGGVVIVPVTLASPAGCRSDRTGAR